MRDLRGILGVGEAFALETRGVPVLFEGPVDGSGVYGHEFFSLTAGVIPKAGHWAI